MNNTVMIIDDDDARANKIKAALKSSSINVLAAENLYELVSQIYKYGVRVLIFDPNLSWINVKEFINGLKKLPDYDEFTIFFFGETPDKETQKLGITCIRSSSHISKLVSKIETLVSTL